MKFHKVKQRLPTVYLLEGCLKILHDSGQQDTRSRIPSLSFLLAAVQLAQL